MFELRSVAAQLQELTSVCALLDATQESLKIMISPVVEPRLHKQAESFFWALRRLSLAGSFVNATLHVQGDMDGSAKVCDLL